MTRAVTAAAAALAAIPLLMACGGGGEDEEPEPVRGPAREVVRVVETFERATAARDFDRVCRDLLTARVRRQAGGRNCATLLERTASQIQQPRIRIRKVALKGDRATVDVTTTAAGQAEARDRIELVRVEGRFRISSLSG